MARQPAPKKPTQAAKYAGKRVRINCEAQALAHYEACTTAPERVSIRIGGIITIVPVEFVELLSSMQKQEAAAA